jgi:hypothetical protein
MPKKAPAEPAIDPSALVYRHTGLVTEGFHFLPADPPSQDLEPGDLVVTNEPVQHARLEPVSDAAIAAAAQTASEAEAPEGGPEAPPAGEGETLPEPDTAPQGSSEPSQTASEAPQA